MLGLLGLWQLLAGTSRQRGARRARAGGAATTAAGAASCARSTRALRRTQSGQRLGAWLAGAGVKITPVEYLGLVIAGGLAGWVVLSVFLARPGRVRRRRGRGSC